MCHYFLKVHLAHSLVDPQFIKDKINLSDLSKNLKHHFDHLKDQLFDLDFFFVNDKLSPYGFFSLSTLRQMDVYELASISGWVVIWL